MCRDFKIGFYNSQIFMCSTDSRPSSIVLFNFQLLLFINKTLGCWTLFSTCVRLTIQYKFKSNTATNGQFPNETIYFIPRWQPSDGFFITLFHIFLSLPHLHWIRDCLNCWMRSYTQVEAVRNWTTKIRDCRLLDLSIQPSYGILGDQTWLFYWWCLIKIRDISYNFS